MRLRECLDEDVPSERAVFRQVGKILRIQRAVTGTYKILRSRAKCV